MLYVFLSTLTFAIHVIAFWQVYSTNKSLSNGTKFNDFVTLIVACMIKNFLELCCYQGNSVSQTNLALQTLLLY